MDAMATADIPSSVIRNAAKTVKRGGGGLRGEGSLVSMLAKASASTGIGAAASGAYMATDSAAAYMGGGGARLGGGGGALPLPKFDANGHVVGQGTPLVGASKVGSSGKRVSVMHVSSNDIHSLKDAVDVSGPFAEAGLNINRPKLTKGVPFKPGSKERSRSLDPLPIVPETITSNGWITGPNAVEKGMAGLLQDEDNVDDV